MIGKFPQSAEFYTLLNSEHKCEKLFVKLFYKQYTLKKSNSKIREFDLGQID